MSMLIMSALLQKNIKLHFYYILYDGLCCLLFGAIKITILEVFFEICEKIALIFAGYGFGDVELIFNKTWQLLTI